MDSATISELIQALKPCPGLLSLFLDILTDEEFSRYTVQILGLPDGEPLSDSKAGDQDTRSHLARLAASHYYVEPVGYPGI